eukprot:3906112-Rhodomonas_salina.1
MELWSQWIKEFGLFFCIILFAGVWVTNEHVRFSALVFTFSVGFTCGVATLVGTVYYVVLFRFQVDIFDLDTHNLVCTRPN